MSGVMSLHDIEYTKLSSIGVFDLLVGPSIHTKGDGNYCDSNLYLIYNRETCVVEEEVKYSPQAYSYLSQLSTEWDNRIDGMSYTEAGTIAANAITRIGAKANKDVDKGDTVINLESKRNPNDKP